MTDSILWPALLAAALVELEVVDLANAASGNESSLSESTPTSFFCDTLRFFADPDLVLAAEAAAAGFFLLSSDDSPSDSSAARFFVPLPAGVVLFLLPLPFL